MAYGARLESVLGASPRGFESPILRHRTPEPAQVSGFSFCLQRKVAIVGEGCCSNESRVFPLVMELEGNTRGTKYEISATVVWMLVGSFPACGVGAAGVPGAASPARPRAVRAASFARRVVSKPGQAPQASRRPPIGRACRSCVAALALLPPSGTAAWPCVSKSAPASSP